MPDRSSAPRPVFIFDGACGFCTSSAGALRRWFDPKVTYAIAPYQRLDLHAYGLTEADCDAAAQFVTASGAVYSGHRSIGQALRHSLPLWRPLGRVLLCSQLDALAGAAYAWVAEHRGRLPSGPPACAGPNASA
ncbi:MAG TPA: DCC1-like thiol-disulfide oxidoreductase family protein [Ornithinimicrobium sp.]|uniref:thiol-disulfide oxidoreductase DCC family protein n=1 Tax=Ornithinimicrobium sp. TaxID=1977084 RepID=UPI002B46130D|nr:DCC1-like thiol-disulfide oxidoreductase family protein [Ornithinimicrobium sp.]HKJ11431.1 DCC1-like thiol-disulfide oxidoreductase family protein [Ornithinimicrobium sp.]